MRGLLVVLCALVLPVAAGFRAAPRRTLAPRQAQHRRRATDTSSDAAPHAADDAHPAVIGWPEKYSGTGGPRVLHAKFAVEPASDALLAELDVSNWPTWTTASNENWRVGVTRVDKVMPYGELSHMISGELEIVPQGGGAPVIVRPGDFVTFPFGFVASWTVRKELTWHYYLY